MLLLGQKEIMMAMVRMKEGHSKTSIKKGVNRYNNSNNHNGSNNASRSSSVTNPPIGRKPLLLGDGREGRGGVARDSTGRGAPMVAKASAGRGTPTALVSTAGEGR
jgi:hypothetical protein